MKKQFAKLFAGAAIFLGIAGITGSALAAYIITGGTKKGEANTDVTEVIIENKVVSIKNASITDGPLVFEDNTNSTNSFITGNQASKLTVNLDLEVQATDVAYIDDISINYAAVSKTAYKEDKTKNINATIGNYIVAPTKVTITKADFKSPANEGIFKTSIPLTWSWGAEFNNLSPIAYFNQLKPIDENTVVTKMEAFKAATQDLTYVVELTMAETK